MVFNRIINDGVVANVVCHHPVYVNGKWLASFASVNADICDDTREITNNENIRPNKEFNIVI
jgi:hypothetical protein